ncbi:alpha/beta fold hydrolase [Blastochloris viridis]|uniref:Beta-ketoadipate enol-lactone hydrolase n=1 Tax=Blastochloris viridis TaxID=1079 RepID=A0A0H5BHX0_BLAVI|nr:alpha/beta fold hydrolase [Blastochloris viridis]ALK09376.1 Putative non-heme bromoperoxidase BpoC [Blastochloris viridis]BAS00745.1 beta-ketoadipate enol-lactone hydrolase [Blastochloris viridis]CUU42039.1 Putative non-heme bromoperoxidase BpoC [Blastochloris viridis]
MSELLPLLMVPALGCTGELYAAQTAAVSDREVVVADATGHDSIAAMAAEILETAPPRFALAGLSMGGYVVLELWRQAPDRIGKLALLDTQARPDAPAAADVRKRMIELGEDGRLDMIHEALWPRLVAPNRREDRALEIVVRRMLQEVGAEAFVRQQRAILGRVDSRPTLPTITVPTLVLVGADDQLTPPDLAREMAAAIPKADLVMVPGSGHLSTLEKPDAVNAALAGWLVR